MIYLYKNDTKLGTELSFKISEAIAEKGKAFSCGKFVKHCLMIFAERAFPDKKYLVKQTSLSRFIVAHWINALWSHLEDALAERIRKFSPYNLAIDESVDISNTAQLVVFVRRVAEDFEVDEKLLDMASMKSTTTGENIAQEVLKVVEKFWLDPKKMFGLTTDGAPVMVMDLSRSFWKHSKHKVLCWTIALFTKNIYATKLWMPLISWKKLFTVSITFVLKD